MMFVKKLLAGLGLGEVIVKEENFSRTSPWKTEGQCTKFWQNLPLEMDVLKPNFWQNLPLKMDVQKLKFWQSLPLGTPSFRDRKVGAPVIASSRSTD